MYYGNLGIPICPLFLFSKAPFHDRGNYKDESLTLTEVSQLIWAAQGITHPGGYRTALSAGALYPLELYAVVGNVTDLQAGIYKYRQQGLELEKVVEGDVRAELRAAALDQGCTYGGGTYCPECLFAGCLAGSGTVIMRRFDAGGVERLLEM